MNKLVIYTCLTGDYDSVQSVPVNEHIDFVMFTDINQQRYPLDSNWTILPVDKSLKLNPQFLNRHYKFHPHIYFPNHSFSIYIDSNISIINIEHILERHYSLEQSKHTISIPDHPWRHCIYEECLAITQDGKDSFERVAKNLKLMIDSGYPTDNGFFENNLIWRKHHDSKIIELMNAVWELFTKPDHSYRDQLVVAYLAWKLDVKIEPFFEMGKNCRNSGVVSWHDHNDRHEKNFFNRLSNFFHKLRT